MTLRVTVQNQLKDPLNLYLSVMLLVQVGYWYLGSPGPYILASTERSLASATLNIAWALALFLVIPVLTLLVTRQRTLVPLGVGDWRVGLPLTLGLALMATGVMYVSSADSALQQTYPWAGAWVGQTRLTFVLWAGLYALYYLSFEFFYRGFVLRVLEPRWGVAAAVWAQVLMSTLIHVGKPLPETLAAFPAGFLFAFLALRTRSLVWPSLVHLAVGLATDAFILQRQGLFL